MGIRGGKDLGGIYVRHSLILNRKSRRFPLKGLRLFLMHLYARKMEYDTNYRGKRNKNNRMPVLYRLHPAKASPGQFRRPPADGSARPFIRLPSGDTS